MKKIFMFLLSAMLIVLMSISAFAAQPEDELVDIKDNIIKTANDLFGEDINRTISASDIDLGDAYKIYVGTNIFKIESNEASALEQLLEMNGYIYELPIYVDGNTILVNIAKGQPLDKDINATEEEKQEILENTGKWHVSAVKFYENQEIDYDTIINDAIKAVPEDVILVGGLPNFRYAVALIQNEDGEIDKLVPLSGVPGVKTIAKFKTDNNKNIYDYEQIKDYINSLPIDDPDLTTGSYGFPVKVPPTINYILLVEFIIVILAVIGTFVIRKQLNSNS